MATIVVNTVTRNVRGHVVREKHGTAAYLCDCGDLQASTCFQEIVKIFVSLEQRNFSLLTYVNQQSFDCIQQSFPCMVFGCRSP